MVLALLAFIVYFMQSANNFFGNDLLSTIIVVFALSFLIAATIFTNYYLITQYCTDEKSKL
jgi:cell shape-determining protein MreD